MAYRRCQAKGQGCVHVHLGLHGQRPTWLQMDLRRHSVTRPDPPTTASHVLGLQGCATRHHAQQVIGSPLFSFLLQQFLPFEMPRSVTSGSRAWLGLQVLVRAELPALTSYRPVTPLGPATWGASLGSTEVRVLGLNIGHMAPASRLPVPNGRVPESHAMSLRPPTATW